MTAQPVGTPVWLELSTNDPDRAQEFYRAVFGWEFSAPAPPTDDAATDLAGDLDYRFIRSGESLVGGFLDVRAVRCPDGGGPAPSAWSVYLAVDDLAARTARARTAGAEVLIEGAPAGTAGHWSMVVDPTGAPVGLWQPGDTDSYDVTGAAGTPVWFDLVTADFGAATAFYRDVFDFDLPPGECEEQDGLQYVTDRPGPNASAGIFGAPWARPGQSYWRIYFGVDGADAAAERVRAAGGTVTDGPEDSPFGRIVTVKDPEGSLLQLCSPDEATPA